MKSKKHENSLKNEEHLKNEGHLNNEDHLKSEDDVKNEFVFSDLARQRSDYCRREANFKFTLLNSHFLNISRLLKLYPEMYLHWLFNNCNQTSYHIPEDHEHFPIARHIAERVGHECGGGHVLPSWIIFSVPLRINVFEPKYFLST